MKTKFKKIQLCEKLTNQEIYICMNKLQDILNTIYHMRYIKRKNHISLKDKMILKVYDLIFELKFTLDK